MVWGRRRQRTNNVVADPNRKGRFTVKDTNTGPTNSWEQWLHPTALCEATVFVIFNDRMLEGIPTTFARTTADTKYDKIAVGKGETCIYVGELYRRRVKDPLARGGIRIDVAHKFFSPRFGPIIADPACFKDAMEDDVKDTDTE